MLRNIIKRILNLYAKRSSHSLIKYYRKKGITIGSNCIFRSPWTTQIDIMRPSLISIGNNVDMNKNFTIMAHDFSHRVFLQLYNEFLSSSGSVTIGSNIYFGTNVTILKGISIGDNCIIGAGSIVTKSIPANSVATGVPCKVICSIEEYYKKRQKLWINEAIAYANAIREKEKREPTIEDFLPEFALYIDKRNINNYDLKPIKMRLNEKFDNWIENHEAIFNGFDDFLSYSLNNKQFE